MAKSQPPSFRQFLAPRYWPTWTGIGLLSLIAWTPYRFRIWCGTGIGLASFRLAGKRRYITETNIRLCFPELDTSARREMTRKTFIANGIGLIETATGWVRSAEHFRDEVSITGLETLREAKGRGRGVLMLGAHYSTLDFAASLLSLSCPFAVTYRPHRNPLFDAFMHKGRLRNCNAVFDRRDIRGAFRHLKKGEVLWYAPDQDYGPDHAVYAPFFGRRAATITAPARFAAFNDSPVVIVRHHRKEHERGYELEFTLVEEEFPSGDAVRDAALINKKLEQAIRRYPHQYLWMHKRFKTQPEGKPGSPYIDIPSPRKRISRKQLNRLTEGAEPLEERPAGDTLLQLPNGMQLRFFPGAARRFTGNRHPAVRCDRRTRQLRTNGIGCITVDAIYSVTGLNLCAMTLHSPRGTTLARLLSGGGDARELPLAGLAAFYARLHNAGFLPVPVRLDKLLYDGDDFIVLNPEEIDVLPGNLSYPVRCDNLAQLFRLMENANGTVSGFFQTFCRDYAETAGFADAESLAHDLSGLRAETPVLADTGERT